MKTSKTIAALLAVALMTSCATVDSGHKGVEVSWGGETNMDMIYNEGMDGGIHWIWDHMVDYDVREKTMVEKFTFNDANNMTTGVEFALDYNLNPGQVNLIHTQITDIETKIAKTLKSAGKEVVPQYTASDLNLSMRQRAEEQLTEILSNELPEFYVEFARIQVTDVDIPAAIAQAAERTAEQIEKNKLALEKAEEAENNFAAAEWNAKTKAELSKPEMIALQKVENERIIAEGFKQHGKSFYGENNMFGMNAQGILLNR